MTSKEQMQIDADRRTAEANRHANQQYEKALKGEKGKPTNSCFPAGTKVLTNLGRRRIEEISVGEYVVSINPITGQKQICRVLKSLKHDPCEIVQLGFSNGTSLRTTATHSFRSDNSWKAVFSMVVGDTMSFFGTDNGLSSKTISSITMTGKSESVYNLITENQHTFLAEGAIAHNFTYFRKTRSTYWRILSIFQKFSSAAARAHATIENY